MAVFVENKAIAALQHRERAQRLQPSGGLLQRGSATDERGLGALDQLLPRPGQRGAVAGQPGAGLLGGEPGA